VEESVEYISSVTSKGQVTIPAVIREKLGIGLRDKVIFRIVDDRVEVEPLTMTLAEAYGSVTPLNRPEDFAELRRIAREERVAQFLAKSEE
jgi:antitoxin PrlF